MNLLRELDSDDRVMTGAIMTTFPFAPRFFERSVLPALRDKDVDDTIAVLVDGTQYESTLTEADGDDDLGRLGEQQPHYAGQRYHLAPIAAPSRRAFHPKVHYLAGERRVQATVSSANLTHPGLTNNREIATWMSVDAPTDDTDVDTSDDGDMTRGERVAICSDIAAFLRALVDSPFGRSIDAVTGDTIERTLDAGDWLETMDTPRTDHRSTRFLHNLDRPLLSQVRRLIADRDEAIQRVDIAAPFYGTSMAVPRVFTDEDIETRLWLQHERVQLPLDGLADWTDAPSASALGYEANRYVHGKVICIRTDSAAYCLSGSPNASQAALLSAADDGGNIEAAVFRRAAEPDRFDYLFETAPFDGAEPIDIDTFEPDTSLDTVEDHDASGTSDTTLALHGVSYRRRDSYDGGTLTVTGAVNESIRDTIRDDGAELVVTAPDATADPATVQLRAHEFEWIDDDRPISFRASTDLYGNAAERPFIHTGRANLRCDRHTSTARWVQTHTPTTGEPTAADVADAGATTVPRALAELYQGDTERRTEVIESLNGLLSALRDVGGDDVGEGEVVDADEEEGPRGGLRVRPWTQSGGRDPDALIESFYDGWETDLKEFVRTMDSETYHFEEVETRLTAINAATLQLLLLDEGRSKVEVPRQAAVNAIKDVYSEQDLRGVEGSSLVADYCSYLRHYAEQSDERADEIYDGLQTHILPHILFATLIVEAHVAGDRETFFQQQDWAFEALIGECFPKGYPTPDHLDTDHLDNIVTTIGDAIEGIRSRIEGSPQLERQADRRYMDDDQLRVGVIELLGRVILHSGREAVETYRKDPKHEARMEQVFERFLPHLPPGQRRDAERWL